MGTRPSLLIVDDEPNVLLTLRMVFENSGYIVTTADGSAQARQLIRTAKKLDAVLTDMSMEEDQSGLQVVQAAAQLKPRPVIIVFTGFGTMENLEATHRSVVDYFALKPLDLDDFKRVLHRLLALRDDRLVSGAMGGL